MVPGQASAPLRELTGELIVISLGYKPIETSDSLAQQDVLRRLLTIPWMDVELLGIRVPRQRKRTKASRKSHGRGSLARTNEEIATVSRR